MGFYNKANIISGEKKKVFQFHGKNMFIPIIVKLCSNMHTFFFHPEIQCVQDGLGTF